MLLSVSNICRLRDLHLLTWRYLNVVLSGLNQRSEMIDERRSSSILRKTISEPQTGIEPSTFCWPVRRSNHWATKTRLSYFQHINFIYIIVNILLAYANVAHICRTCTLAVHLSLGSSMVRESHRSWEGWGFDPRLGLRNRFSEDRAWRSFIYRLLIFPSSDTSNI